MLQPGPGLEIWPALGSHLERIRPDYRRSPLAVGFDPTAVRPLRRIKTRRPHLAPQNPNPFRSFPFLCARSEPAAPPPGALLPALLQAAVTPVWPATPRHPFFLAPPFPFPSVPARVLRRRWWPLDTTLAGLIAAPWPAAPSPFFLFSPSRFFSDPAAHHSHCSSDDGGHPRWSEKGTVAAPP